MGITARVTLGFLQRFRTPGTRAKLPSPRLRPPVRAPLPSEEVTSRHGNRCQGAVSKNPQAPRCLPRVGRWFREEDLR